MSNINIVRYDEDNELWGYIEDDKRSWIIYLDRRYPGPKPDSMWLRRDKDTGAVRGEADWVRTPFGGTDVHNRIVPLLEGLGVDVTRVSRDGLEFNTQNSTLYFREMIRDPEQEEKYLIDYDYNVATVPNSVVIPHPPLSLLVAAGVKLT